MPCLREFVARLDALHLSTVTCRNTAHSPDLLSFSLLRKCDIGHLEGKLHEERDGSANWGEVGLPQLGMPFTTNVFAKGWLLVWDPSPNRKLLVSARSMRNGKSGRAVLTNPPADITWHGKTLCLTTQKWKDGRKDFWKSLFQFTYRFTQLLIKGVKLVWEQFF